MGKPKPKVKNKKFNQRISCPSVSCFALTIMKSNHHLKFRTIFLVKENFKEILTNVFSFLKLCEV